MSLETGVVQSVKKLHENLVSPVMILNWFKNFPKKADMLLNTSKKRGKMRQTDGQSLFFLPVPWGWQIKIDYITENMRSCQKIWVRHGGSNLPVSSVCFLIFDSLRFSIQFRCHSWNLVKPHKYRGYNKNTIGVQTLRVQISMVFSYVRGTWKRYIYGFGRWMWTNE